MSEPTPRRRRNAYLRQLLESVAEGVYGVDREGRCTFVNAALLRILGYERPEQLVGRPIHDLIHHSHADGTPYPAAECHMCRAYQHDEAVHRDDEVFWRRDGRAVPVEYRAHPVRVGGRVVGAVASFLDISERRLAEQRLRQSAMVFEHTRDGVMVLDGQGIIRAVNPALCASTGYADAELVGRCIDLLYSGRHPPEFHRAIWDAVGATGHWQGEVWQQRKIGEPYPAWWSVSAVPDEAGGSGHYVGVCTDLSPIRGEREKLDHLTHHDLLTGLPNRVLTRLRLEHAIEGARRHGRRLGVLTIGLKRFKDVNDGLGPLVGDRLLVALANRLAERVRKEDTLGRIGGDEFLLLIESLRESQDAAGVARDLLAALARPFAVADGQEVYLDAAIGISVYPDDADTADALLRDAGAALARAREAGAGQFRFYTADMNAHALAELQLESALRRALERGELELHYQPKADLRSGRVVGAEVLLRWRRDGSEWISPARFIPLAEKTGLILPISAWVLDTACAQLAAWRAAGLSPPRVAVNVSVAQLRAGDLAAQLAAVLARHAVAPELLELELTESMLLDDPAAAVALLGRLKGLGVKLALDDFGTGYSSLAYLRRLPIDTLKIDKRFVDDLVSDPTAAGLVATIIELARRLRLAVVAEGVEHEAQLGYLRKLGCDQLQGYLFSPALPAAEFAALLAADRCLPPEGAPEGTAPTLLLVDDEAAILAALRRVLRGEGYHILCAGGAREAFDLLARHDVRVIVSDQRMPEMNGSEFLARVRDLYPDTVRMVLTGYAEMRTIIQAINEGAIFRFLNKPWDDALLRAHIREAFRFQESLARGHGAVSRAA